MLPHSSLSVVPDIFAVRTDVSHRNSKTYGLPTVRALQLITLEIDPKDSSDDLEHLVNHIVRVNSKM